MGFQFTKLFRTLELDIRIDGDPNVFFDNGARVEFHTDRPGEAGGILRHNEVLRHDDDPIRRVRSIDFAGDVRGRQFRIAVTPALGVLCTIYAMRIYAKILSPHATSAWQWYAIPVVPTSDGWTEIALPIPPTPDDWSEVPLPIPPTADGWSEVPIPMRSTELQPSWIEIPVDQ